ncbi:MAG: ribonuclease J [Archaeoglobaceae archaeon]
MKITIFDGADTIGGNKIYVEENGRGVFLDFGMNFAKHSKYFEEFLRERSVRGIHDPLHLGLIPRLNVYRSDLIPSDVDLSSYPKLNVEAVLISHAHLDHFGNVAYLHESIPIVASPASLAILKAMRDSGKQTGGSEIPYYSLRENCEDERVLKAIQNKKQPYLGRNLVCTGEINKDLEEFLCYRPGQESGKGIKTEKICCLEEKDLSFEIKAFEVDHSVYGSLGYILYGNIAIAYTGDIRLHGRKEGETKRFVNEAKNAGVLIVEGTRAGRGDYNVTEKEVFENCLKAVEHAKGLVIADFSPRNIERLEMFKEIADKTGRQLVVTAKDAYMLQALELTDRICRMEGVGIYKELKEKRDKWETEVVMKNWENAYVDPVEINRDPESYILCFSFYDMKHLLDIKPSGGIYIYSSSEAHSEEQEFDFLRLQNWLKIFDFEIFGFEIVSEGGKLKPEFVKGYHASGHASKEDLRWIIERIDPEVLIPVHTENAEWFVENFENVKVMGNGESFKCG